ncbi:protein NinF [Enterobacter sp. R1(2018)]|uniref:protein NinF n=1 Tax=Enterobacter sp. R1(2018) TaxID=2447891 RepID=UPI000EABED65|nr:protein NinF [Enterobacter sp. R1(2018)]RKQ38377.1 NinF family protein [Enterobacter sp. R1(2018)]
MLTPESITDYQRQSNAAAGYCAACMKPLQPGEVYACNECASEAYVETDPNGRVTDEADTETL